MLPTVSTAGSVGAISRATTVCSRTTIIAASTTGSTDGLRHGAVRAAPVDGDPHAVGGRQRRAGPGADRSRTASAARVGRTRRPRRPTSVRQPVVDHLPGAVAELLGGLEQRDDAPVPVAAGVREQRGRPEQAGDVDVVPAGVHHRHLVAVQVPGGHGARVRQPVRSLTGSASMSARSSTVGPSPLRSTPTTPVPPMPSCTSIPERAEPLGDARRPCAAPGGTFGMLVQVAVEVLLPERLQIASRLAE